MRSRSPPMACKTAPPPPTMIIARPLLSSFSENSRLAIFSGCNSAALMAIGPMRMRDERSASSDSVKNASRDQP